MARRNKVAAPVTPGLPPFYIRTLTQMYTFNDRRQVVRYLEHHQFLVPILVDAYALIDARFPAARLVLTVATDTNADGDEAGGAASDEERLVLSIVASSAEDGTASGPEPLDDAWWQQAQSQAQGKLRLTVEPRRRP